MKKDNVALFRPKKVPLSGLEKTAILMNVLGREKSFEMMKDMKDTDVRLLLKVMGSMKKAPLPLVNAVLREYLYRLLENEEIIFEENLSTPQVVKEALGEERAKLIFGNLKVTNLVERKSLSALETVDARTLAEFLLEEHPQTIALVVCHLDSVKQIAVIKNLPDALRPEVILRMASLSYVSPEKVEELDEVLRKELAASGKNQRNVVGGINAVAELVNNLDKKTLTSLMTRLEDKDPILAEEIRSQMFTFNDITGIDNKGIQTILREVPSDKLLLALKSAPDELKDKIYSCMSERAAEMLKEDLASMGPTKVSDVEVNAQREIVGNIVKRLRKKRKRYCLEAEKNQKSSPESREEKFIFPQLSETDELPVLPTLGFKAEACPEMRFELKNEIWDLLLANPEVAKEFEALVERKTLEKLASAHLVELEDLRKKAREEGTTQGRTEGQAAALEESRAEWMVLRGTLSIAAKEILQQKADLPPQPRDHRLDSRLLGTCSGRFMVPSAEAKVEAVGSHGSGSAPACIS